MASQAVGFIAGTYIKKLLPEVWLGGVCHTTLLHSICALVAVPLRVLCKCTIVELWLYIGNLMLENSAEALDILKQ